MSFRDKFGKLTVEQALELNKESVKKFVDSLAGTYKSLMKEEESERA